MPAPSLAHHRAPSRICDAASSRGDLTNKGPIVIASGIHQRVVVSVARFERAPCGSVTSRHAPCTAHVRTARGESKVGAKGRRKFEKFLRDVAKDEDGDVIDVKSK